MVSGIGSAFAQMIVYGESFADSMKNLFKSIAAQVIQSLVSIAVKWLLTTETMMAIKRALFAEETAQNAALVATGTARHDAPAIGWGALATGLAAGLAAIALSALIFSKAMADTGLTETPPGRSMVSVEGGERILSRDQNRDLTEFMQGGRDRPVQLVLNDRVLGEVLVDMTREGRLPLVTRR